MNPTEVRRLAGLARIHLTEAEVERFAGQLGSVVEYFEILQTLPAAPDPGAASTLEAEVQSAPLREDVAVSYPRAERLIEGSAGCRGGFIEVPRVLD